METRELIMEAHALRGELMQKFIENYFVETGKIDNKKDCLINDFLHILRGDIASYLFDRYYFINTNENEETYCEFNSDILKRITDYYFAFTGIDIFEICENLKEFNNKNKSFLEYFDCCIFRNITWELAGYMIELVF